MKKNLSKKAVITIMCLLTFSLTTSSVVCASPTNYAKELAETESRVNSPAVSVSKATVYLNGTEVSLENPLLNASGRTYLPVREIANLLGAETEWDAENRIVTITQGSTQIDLLLNKSNAVKTDTSTMSASKVPIDSENNTVIPFVYEANSRTYLPVRFCAENLSANADYFENGGNKELHLTTSGHTRPTEPKNPYVKNNKETVGVGNRIEIGVIDGDYAYANSETQYIKGSVEGWDYNNYPCGPNFDYDDPNGVSEFNLPEGWVIEDTDYIEKGSKEITANSFPPLTGNYTKFSQNQTGTNSILDNDVYIYQKYYDKKHYCAYVPLIGEMPLHNRVRDMYSGWVLPLLKTSTTGDPDTDREILKNELECENGYKMSEGVIQYRDNPLFKATSDIDIYLKDSETTTINEESRICLWRGYVVPYLGTGGYECKYNYIVPQLWKFYFPNEWKSIHNQIMLYGYDMIGKQWTIGGRNIYMEKTEGGYAFHISEKGKSLNLNAPIYTFK